MKIITDSQKIDEILNRGTIVEIFPTKKEFREKLLSGDRMKIYIGFDATAPTLHLSHAKNFMLMEKFRQLGHEVIILFGDFTARIGDPTGEVSSRKQLSREEVLHNIKRWKELVVPLMDFNNKENPPKIMYNSKWLSILNFEDLINLASNFTVQQMIKRDMFEKRLKKGQPIYLHEFLYPLMQGYDSVAMEVDVEVCGTDQIFNALAGRTLLKKLKSKEKYVVAVTLMENPKTGELMSKSRGIGVFLDTSPGDMFGQIMAQPDEMIEILFVNNTNIPLKEIKNIIKSDNPKEVKMRLAYEIVKIYHGEEKAKKAESEFDRIFKKREMPERVPEMILDKGDYNIIDLLVKLNLAPSKGQSRRLVVERAVKIDGKIINDLKANINIISNLVVQVGKRHFKKIKVKQNVIL